MSDPLRYHFGIICAVPIEYTAIQLILDERHQPPSRIHHPDTNNYTLGRIGNHDVVIAILPHGEYGVAPVASASTHMIHSFPNIKTGLMVGVGGGVPSEVDVRLGDVVVSLPKEGGSGVIQYDFGKKVQKEELRLTRYLNQAPVVLRTAAASLRSKLQQGLQLGDKAEEVLSRSKLPEFVPSAIDHLYKSNVIHTGAADCSSCEKSGLVERPLRSHEGPMVHYGLIASADSLMKDAELRDQLAKKYGGILCFEMEAAGLVNHFPCLIVRGICDYSDTHKNKDWQGYAALIAAIYAKELLSLIEPSQLHETQNFSIAFGLPGAPIPGAFYGRGDDLLRLEEILSGPWKSIKSSISDEKRYTAVICGLGGMGKTQLAIEYARRHSKDYTAVLWFDGKDERSLENSFVASLERLKMAHPGAFSISTESIEAKIAVGTVLQWLNNTHNHRWLLIFDNVDDPDIPEIISGSYDVRKYFPSSLHGHIIITTRCTVHPGPQLMLRKISNAKDCLDILKFASGRPNIDKDAKIEDLLQRLDGLPLALTTAGSYLSQTPDSVGDYLQLYSSDSWLELQRDTIGLPEHEGRTLGITWGITADLVKTKDALAWRLLELWVFLSNQDLWYELLSAGRENAPEWFRSVIETKGSFKEHMRILHIYGLVDIQLEPAGYGIHKCLHDWLKAGLSDTKRKELHDIALACVALSVPGPDFAMARSTKDWPLQRRLLPHAEEYSAKTPHQAQKITYLNHLSRLGNLYYNNLRLEDAENIYKQVSQNYEKLSGTDGQNTLLAMFTLSWIYSTASKMSDAETTCRQILSATSRSPNVNRLLHWRTKMKLAMIYCSGSRTAEAETILLSVKSTISKEPEWDSFDEVRLSITLGRVYNQQSRYIEAKETLKQASAMMKTLDDHYDYWDIACKDELSRSCTHIGDFGEAEQLSAGLHTTTKAKFGDQHQDTLQAANTLGELYIKTNRLDEANSLLSKAYEVSKAKYGADNLLTLRIGDSLAVAFLQRCELTLAENLLIDTLTRCDRTIGLDHLGTLNVARNLGDVYRAQKRFNEARKIYNRVYSSSVRELGIENAWTKETCRRLDEVDLVIRSYEYGAEFMS